MAIVQVSGLVSPLVDYGNVPDIFANGVGRLETIAGGLIRQIFYVESLTHAGSREFSVVAKIIRPLESVQVAWPLFQEITCAVPPLTMM